MDLSLYGFEGLSRTFNIHPAFVHFPIALVPVTFIVLPVRHLFSQTGAAYRGASLPLPQPAGGSHRRGDRTEGAGLVPA
jgi:hypothetical protein